MSSRLPIVLAAAAMACGTACTANAASLSGTDSAFLTTTAQGAAYELAVAKLALKKTSRADIKSYANTMISAHKPLDAQLHQLAQENDVTLPTGMTSYKQASYNHLSSLNGQKFNTAFVNAETSDNKDDMGTEQKEIDSTSDAKVKAFVEQLHAADTKHAQIGESLQLAGQ